ncbi:MAG: HD domain-containing phosphohydrolase [Leptolinea sp.]
MTNKILLVDDEILLLESLRRELSFQYNIETAESGAEGLEKISGNGPFAVIVSDFRMPKMDGIKFLIQAMEIAPNTVRMMLTGNTDLPTAIDAINQGQIFRFLSKPCTGKLLSQSLDAGLRQYQLVMAEKELLEKTLKESIGLLTEVLAIVNTKAYGRSLRIQQLVVHIIKELKITDSWQYEAAAALSQLGWIIFPQEMLDKISDGQSLSASETVVFSKHPFTASKLLENIPRLELVSRMIAGQGRSLDDLCLDPAVPEAYTVDLGSHILKICIDYDQLHLQGLLHDQILVTLLAKQNIYNQEILNSLKSLHSFQSQPGKKHIEVITLEELEVGMLLAEPVKDINGKVLVSENTNVTRSIVIELLKMGTQANSGIGPLKILRKTEW